MPAAPQFGQTQEAPMPAAPQFGQTQGAPVVAQQQPLPVQAGTVGLPANVTAASPWERLASYLVEAVLMVLTLWIGWAIWASMLAPRGQTPAKKLLKHRVISAESIRPVGFGNMFFMRGLLAGFVAVIASSLTLGIILLMPFWDKRNQNIWDKISGTYVVSDPTDAWGLEPDLR